METPQSMPTLDMALMGAAKTLDLEKVLQLLEEGASAKFKHDPEGVWGSKDSYTALHAAILARHQEGSGTENEGKSYETKVAVIRALLEAGAEVNATKEDYNWKGSGSTRTAFELVLPMAMKDVSLMSSFLDANADPNTKSRRAVHSMRTDGFYESYVLHTAVAGGYVKVVEMLLQKRASVDALSRQVMNNERGHNQNSRETALHTACERKDVEMCGLLLTHMANVNASTHYLEHIEQEGSVEDDPRSEDYVPSIRCAKVVKSPLHIAIINKEPALMQLLLCSGSDRYATFLRDGTSKTPQELCYETQPELVAVLGTIWTPSNHRLFTFAARRRVLDLLLVAKRLDLSLPSNVLYRVLEFAVPDVVLAPTDSSKVEDRYERYF